MNTPKDPADTEGVDRLSQELVALIRQGVPRNRAAKRAHARKVEQLRRRLARLNAN